jgi:tetratricopeptide (TPR) repeat protein
MMKKIIIMLPFLFLTSTLPLAQSLEDYLLKGDEFKARGKLLHAEGQYLLAIESDPKMAEAHARLGEIYTARKKFQKAIESFESALSLGYSEPLLFVQLAYSYKSSGDLDSAIDVYQRFITQYPNLPEAHLGLGGFYDQKGMKSKAEEEYGIYRKLKKTSDSSS